MGGRLTKTNGVLDPDSPTLAPNPGFSVNPDPSFYDQKF
jgi:hypothetical protein